MGDAEITEKEEPKTSVLLQMFDQNDQKHDAGHRRLREGIRELEERVLTLEKIQLSNRARLTKIETTPTDVSKLVFTPALVFGIVTMCMSIAGGMWASTYGIRQDVSNILTRMSDQVKIDEANARLQEERSSTLRDAIEAVKRAQQQQQYDIQKLQR